MKNTLLLSLSLALLPACDRMKVEGMSKLRIQIPLASSVPSVSQKSDLSAMDFNDSRQDATGFTAASGSRPINCYVVAVGGPEPAMQRNTCTTKPDATGTTAIARKVGLWAGAFPAGGDVSLDVPSGKDRYVILMGFYAAAGDCKDMRQGERSNDSSPIYYLGESRPVELIAGATQEVPVTVAAFDNSKKGDCEGPDFPAGNSFVPTQMTLEKNNMPANAFLEGQCDSITVKLKDVSDRYGSTKSQTSFSLNQIIANTLTAVKIYETQALCVGDTSSALLVNINSNNDRKTFYIKAPASSGTLNLQLTSASNLTHSAQQFSVLPSPSPTPYAIGISIPERILPGICYPINFYPYDYTSMWSPMGISNFHITGLNNLSLFSGISCATPLLVGANTNSSGQHSIKYTGTSEVGSIDTDLNGFTNKMTVHKGYGDTTPVARLMGPMNITGTGGCYEYRVYVTNSQWTFLPNAIVANISASNGVNFSNTPSTCAAHAGSQSVSIAAGEYSKVIYIQFVSTGQKTITLDSKTYMINVQ